MVELYIPMGKLKHISQNINLYKMTSQWFFMDVKPPSYSMCSWKYVPTHPDPTRASVTLWIIQMLKLEMAQSLLDIGHTRLQTGHLWHWRNAALNLLTSSYSTTCTQHNKKMCCCVRFVGRITSFMSTPSTMNSTTVTPIIKQGHCSTGPCAQSPGD